MPQFRTSEELARSQWAEKYMSVAEGKLYSSDRDSSPFPVHEYFKLGLLGKNITMLEVNAGQALVENLVSDTLTEMKIQVGEGDDTAEQAIRDWLDSIDYEAKLEEAVRDFYGVGYGVQQPIRTQEGKENAYTVITVDPSTWYPDLPTFTYQKVTSGRIVSVFSEETKSGTVWYAFVEEHGIGSIGYKLYQLDGPGSLEGKEVPLETLSQFEGLKDTKTDLNYLGVFQIDRQKSSRYLFGSSILSSIWGILQEVSEIQTQIRQERIKHFRGRLAVPIGSLTRVDRTEEMGAGLTSKQRAIAAEGTSLYDVNQEIFPIPAGATQLPAYIQWDMQMIEKGSNEIDRLLSRAASIVGAPRSVFNLDEKGEIHVDTERRKDRRYVRKVLQGQRRAAQLVRWVIDAWRQWSKAGGEDPVTVSFASPFDLTQDETVDLMRKMNRDEKFVSRKQALKEIWKGMKPEERDALEQEIEAEEQASRAETMSSLNRIPQMQL